MDHCDCCGGRDLMRTYIQCQHCHKRLCLKCVAVHPSPELCSRRSFQCTHGERGLVGRGNDHVKENPTERVYSFGYEFSKQGLKGG